MLGPIYRAYRQFIGPNTPPYTRPLQLGCTPPLLNLFQNCFCEHAIRSLLFGNILHRFSLQLFGLLDVSQLQISK